MGRKLKRNLRTQERLKREYLLRLDFEKYGGIVYYQIPDAARTSAERLLPFNAQENFIAAAKRLTNKPLLFLHGYHACGIDGETDLATGHFLVDPGMSVEEIDRILKASGPFVAHGFSWQRPVNIRLGQHMLVGNTDRENTWLEHYRLRTPFVARKPGVLTVLEIHVIGSCAPKRRRQASPSPRFDSCYYG